MNLTLEQYESLNPVCEVKVSDASVRYSTPNRFTKWRVDSLFSKEPITIEWLSKLKPDSVLLDVGANVGMYTIWAATTRGSRVYAFEPEAGNYAILNKNIQINGLSQLVSAYCIGLLDYDGFSTLNLSDTAPGGSCHTVGQELGFDLKPRNSAFVQGCPVSSVDSFCERAKVKPTHIKIDVDGLEAQVINGMRGLLSKRAFESMIIELNTNLSEHQEIITELLSFGYKYDPNQVERALRKTGVFKGVGEYVFARV